MASIRTILALTTALLISILLTGCAESPFQAYRAAPDNFNPGSEHLFSSPIDIQPITFGGNGSAWFRFNTLKKGTTSSWNIETYWLGKDWLFVNNIAFNIDGKITNSPSTNNNREIVHSVGVSERQFSPAPQELITALTQAQTVIVRFSGQIYYLEKQLTAQEVTNIKWYINFIKEGK